jgi:hypothetical protein
MAIIRYDEEYSSFFGTFFHWVVVCQTRKSRNTPARPACCSLQVPGLT